MNDLKSKKTWEIPQLIVLVRSKPEEAVLSMCKHPSTINGPGGNYCSKSDGSGACQAQNLKS